MPAPALLTLGDLVSSVVLSYFHWDFVQLLLF